MATKRVKSKDYVDSSDDSEVEAVPTSKKPKVAKKETRQTKTETRQTKRETRLTKKADVDSNSEEESSDTNSWPLSAKRFVNINNFRGKLMVDIREFYQDDSGELKPGKKGISLSLEQWENLKKIIPEIDAKLSPN